VVGFLFGDIRIAVHGIDLGGWIDMVGVIPEYQRRGIGSMLVEAFCGECQKEGVRVRAIFREDDEQLIEFWTSVGFQRGKLICYRR
jgi:ribosomal protein S18 acetylase RimI-like enzyme